jgi:methylmalonyl-CoA/ethylmalonyl-CoA epimerase
MLPLKFHHIGVAVANLEKALQSYRDIFDYRVLSGPFKDPIQGVSVCFVGSAEEGNVQIELVEPLAEDSPVSAAIKKGIGAYHVCYEVRSMEAALDHMRANRCLVLGAPVPAVAFEGRQIAWLYTPARQLVELVEAKPESA